jgi:hypothetical protein
MRALLGNPTAQLIYNEIGSFVCGELLKAETPTPDNNQANPIPNRLQFCNTVVAHIIAFQLQMLHYNPTSQFRVSSTLVWREEMPMHLFVFYKLLKAVIPINLSSTPEKLNRIQFILALLT